jgi:hypothetical protein
MRDYAKFVKRGYGRTNHLASIDIRNGRLSRGEGLALEQLHDGRRPASMDWFLGILQITEEEFYGILAKHQVYPWAFDRASVPDGPPLPDMPRWFVPSGGESVGQRDGSGRVVKYV